MNPPRGPRTRLDVLREIRQVATAECLRYLRVAPRSTIMATLVFPFLTILAIYLLPQLRSAGAFHLQRAAWSIEQSAVIDDPSLNANAPLPPAVSRAGGLRKSLEPWLKELQQQPLYRLEEVPNARSAFEQREVTLALIFRPEPGETGQGAIGVEVLRRNDFFSSLFMDRLRTVERKMLSPEQTHSPGALVSGESKQAAVERQGRSGIAQVAPFLLIGFAWFFMTVGAVEAFVVERERRTLEQLLAAPISRLALAWGKILFIVGQSALPQLSGALAFVVLGFSPWVFSVVGLLVTFLVPLGVLAFWYYRDLDSSMAAGWRNGLIFMLGFPLLILTDDVIGTLSPLYHLSKALEGPPPLRFFLGWSLLSLLLSLGAVLWLPRLARRWTV